MSKIETVERHFLRAGDELSNDMRKVGTDITYWLTTWLDDLSDELSNKEVISRNKKAAVQRLKPLLERALKKKFPQPKLSKRGGTTMALAKKAVKKTAVKKAVKKKAVKKVAKKADDTIIGSLLKLLKSPKGISVEKAAERLDVEEASIRSNIDRLRSQGEKVESQGGGVFKAK